MDVSRYLDSLVSLSHFPYHVPLARVLVCSQSRLTCFLLLDTCTVMDRRLIAGHLYVPRFPFRVVDSSMLTFTACAFPFVVC